MTQDHRFHLTRIFSLLIILVAFGSPALGYRILALFPFPGKSHWLVFEPIVVELARRGHNVTVLSSFPRDDPMDNYQDISIAEKDKPTVNVRNIEDLGSQSNVKTVKNIMMKELEDTCRKGLRHPNVQALLHSEKKFDIIVTEVFMVDCFLGFVHKFKTPFVAIRSTNPSPWTYQWLGNPANPAYIPDSLSGKPSRMGFFDRVENTISTLFWQLFHSWQNYRCTEIAREHFGQDMPSLNEIAKQVSVLLVNTHFAYQIAKPLVPGIREIGGVHLPQKKALPKDFEEWISGAENGVILFSLGSMLRAESLSPFKKRAILNAFGELRHRVIIKWEGDQPDSVPSNVKMVKWMPQYDLIRHPNVKLFISHGGLASTTEAVYSGKPMLLIPIFGDQPTNAALLEEKGLAVVIRYSEITKETFLAAARKVLDDPSYQETADRMSLVIRDRLVPPLEEAVYWVEYVARHRGAPWLRTSAHGMPFYQYLLLDVVGFLIVVLALLVLASKFLFTKLIKRSRIFISHYKNTEKKKTR